MHIHYYKNVSEPDNNRNICIKFELHEFSSMSVNKKNYFKSFRNDRKNVSNQMLLYTYAYKTDRFQYNLCARNVLTKHLATSVFRRLESYHTISRHDRDEQQNAQ